MILIAAVAIGFGLMRLCWPSDSRYSPHAVREWANATVGVLMLPVTFAHIVIRLIRPRPRIGRLMCQPGMAASCSGAVAIATQVTLRLLPAIRRQILEPELARGITGFLHSFWYVYGIPAGPAVAASWIALILGRCWRPERGWIDRMGRSIGCFWLAFVLFQWEFGRWTSVLANYLWPWLR
jgi:hypothetical protein